jgi:hypothetical protein
VIVMPTDPETLPLQAWDLAKRRPSNAGRRPVPNGEGKRNPFGERKHPSLTCPRGRQGGAGVSHRRDDWSFDSQNLGGFSVPWWSRFLWRFWLAQMLEIFNLTVLALNYEFFLFWFGCPSDDSLNKMQLMEIRVD